MVEDLLLGLSISKLASCDLDESATAGPPMFPAMSEGVVKKEEEAPLDTGRKRRGKGSRRLPALRASLGNRTRH